MRRVLFILTALLALATTQSALGATIIAWDVPTLTDHSTHVVEARVVEVSSSSTDDGIIMTRNVLAVQSYLKGSGADRIDVMQLGGHVGGLHQVLWGDIRLQAGQQVVLFLSDDGQAVHATLLGWSAFLIHGSGPDAALSRDADGLSLYTQDATGKLTHTEADTLAAPGTLGELRTQVGLSTGGAR
jgi:hypothetical protein